MSWTDDRVETLKRMWSEGQSASAIAKELGGVTRNAVIGKVHRLGLSNRTEEPEAAAPAPAPAPEPVAREKPAAPRAVPQPAAAPLRPKKLTLMELTERTCKWPIGDPATDKFWFCGLPSVAGKPYCEAHVGVAFQPMSSRRDRRR